MFSSEIQNELKFYVYRLIDPRNGETFYIGKGKGNRVFDHASGVVEDDHLSDKLKRIHEIKRSGFEVQHVIHRHGMNEETSFEVEGALIDAYSGITNIMGGHKNNDRGVAHSQQIIERYKAEEADLSQHRLVEITLNQNAENTLYNSVRFCWKMSIAKASQAEFVLAAINGIVIDTFVADQWKDATPQNFPEFDLDEKVEGRIGFVGKPAPETIRKFYNRKRLPKKKRGQANPFRYWNIS